MMYQINLLKYLVVLKSSLEDTNSPVHQTHPAVHRKRCLNKGLRQAEPGGAEVGPHPPLHSVGVIRDIFQPFLI